jgi:YD repeat-containing protein
VNGDGQVGPVDSLLIVNGLGTTDAEQPIVTRFRYDALNRLIARVEPRADDGTPNSVTSYAYDAGGRLVSETDALGHVTTLGYDALDRLTRETLPDPDGSGPLTSPVHTAGYDRLGNRVWREDPLGRVTFYGYDRLQRLVSVTDPLNGQTAFTYDAAGNQLTLKDARHNTTSWSYDNLDRPVQETSPLGGIRSLAYDALGNLLRTTDRRGRERRMTYDRWNRQTLEDWHASGSSPATAGYRYEYDEEGNLTSVFGVYGRAWDSPPVVRSPTPTTPTATGRACARPWVPWPISRTGTATTA